MESPSSQKEQTSMSLSYYRIDLKGIPKRYQSESLLKVVFTSPVYLRREVEKFARYFKNEFRYDSMQFDQKDREPYTAYLFADSEQSVWAGACCFRSRPTHCNEMKSEALHWVWLHPYLRGRGILKTCWKTLRTNHGDFYIQPPISRPMRKFILSHNKDSAWYTIFQCDEAGDTVPR
jgi:hypothetical protein